MTMRVISFRNELNGIIFVCDVVITTTRVGDTIVHDVQEYTYTIILL